MAPISRTDLSNKKMLRVLLQEIADVRKELKEDIASVASDLHHVKADLKALRIQVHQNHTSFITNHQELERRVVVLETAHS